MNAWLASVQKTLKRGDIKYNVVIVLHKCARQSSRIPVYWWRRSNGARLVPSSTSRDRANLVGLGEKVPRIAILRNGLFFFCTLELARACRYIGVKITFKARSGALKAGALKAGGADI